MLGLLRTLAQTAASGSWRPGSGKEIRLCVQSPSSNSGGGPRHFDRALVSEALSAGLIVEAGDHVILAAAGRAWLRRQLAGDDPFLEQHRLRRRRVLATAGSRGGRIVTVNVSESPLAWLRQRKDRSGAPLLTEAQFEAGERLRHDFTFAALGPRVTANWSALAASSHQARATPGADGLRDDVIAARDRVHRALAAVGSELGRVVFDVCCLLKGLATIERELALPQRSGKVILQLGLNALGRYYGLTTGKPSPARPPRMQHWGADGYRPRVPTATPGS
jgi:hypothetical protein